MLLYTALTKSTTKSQIYLKCRSNEVAKSIFQTKYIDIFTEKKKGNVLIFHNLYSFVIEKYLGSTTLPSDA